MNKNQVESMLIKEVTEEDISIWLKLAAEVEPIFQGSMVNNKEFHDYMKGKISKKEAFMALDRTENNELMGIIGFSRTYNRITWLGVFEKYRSKGVGSKLLEIALRQLDKTKEITVTTYRDEYNPGKPARHVYHKFGFVDFDNTVFDDQGNPRCLMRMSANQLAKQGGSFHNKYRRYMEWSKEETCPVCCHEPGPSDIITIKELEHSFLEASPNAQGCLYGKCHVISKKHYVELFDMPDEDMLNFMIDVKKAGIALKKVSGAVKINYEIHGNTVPHLHVHLFPRYVDDKFPGGPIEYNMIEPSPYGSEKEFEKFVSTMRIELEK